MIGRSGVAKAMFAAQNSSAMRVQPNLCLPLAMLLGCGGGTFKGNHAGERQTFDLWVDDFALVCSGACP